VDEEGTATRQRLLAAAVAACVEHGFEGTTVADIAKRARVSGPGIYNHFGGKVELLVEAGRWALDQLTADRGSQRSATSTARAFLSDEFADTRRLLTELHLAAQRHPDVADLLAQWHRDHAEAWMRRVPGPDPGAAVKAYFALLLGICQIDSLTAIAGSNAAVANEVDHMVRLLLPEEAEQ
jgi:AcrR family transcriptional regulator